MRLVPLLLGSLAVIWLVPSVAVRAQQSQSSAPQPSTKQLIADLKALSAAKDFDGLLERCSRTLQLLPRSVAALQYRAFALERLGRIPLARTAYEDLLKVAPKHVWGLTQLARLRTQTGETSRAIELYTRALTADPATLDARYGLADLLRQKDRHAEAITHLSHALEHDADKARAHAALGYAHWCAQASDAARRAWKAAQAAGHDPAACERALALVLHDQLHLPLDKHAALEMRTRRLRGPEWRLEFDGVTVITRVGPKLTTDIEALITSVGKRVAQFLESDLPLPAVEIYLSRTREEHERHRRRLFPQGPRDKAFLFPASWSRGPSSAPGGRRPGSRPAQSSLRQRSPARIYACWFPLGLENSLVHELTHAVTQAHLRFVPIWADEGFSTYTEPAPGTSHVEPFGAVRPDLLLTLKSALDDDFALVPILNSSTLSFQGTGARTNYARSWSLIHYLVHGHEKGVAGLQELFAAYAARPGGGISTFRRTYGDDFEKLEAEWSQHVRKLAAPK